MSTFQYRKHLTMLLGAAAALLSSGCTMVTDEPTPCPAELRVRFVYDYNLKFANAFAHEVKSVNVWAFDPEGNPVWSGSKSGAELAEADFYMETGLPEGRYDFVSWCGLEGNEDFTLDNYSPRSKEELEVKLKTVATEGQNVSSSHLPGLYHGMISEVEYEVDPYSPSIKYVTIPLMKDTKDIRILLQHLDGSPIENRDFSVTITDENALYAWNNSLLPSPLVTYKPWETKYGEVTAPDGDGDKARAKVSGSRAITTVASLLFDLSTGRLMTDHKAILTVHRNWDNRDIIRIPLIDYLLLVKGHYGDMTDQEYLDRQDDYSIVFFIDPASNWYAAGGIFINNWAVVPPDDQEL